MRHGELMDKLEVEDSMKEVEYYEKGRRFYEKGKRLDSSDKT